MRSPETLIKQGGGIKVLKTDGDFVTIGGHGVIFDSPDSPTKDLDGEWFTKDTEFGSRKGDGSDVLFHHGFPVANTKAAVAISDYLFPPVKVTEDELGLVGEVVLDMRNEYEAWLADQAGKTSKSGQPALGWSTGAVGVKRDNGWLKRWIIGEWSPTPQPAEPRTVAVPIKSILLPHKAVSLSQQIEDIHRAFYAQWDFDHGWVAEVFDEYVIAEIDGSYYQIPYSGDGDVTFASVNDWTEVERTTNWAAKNLYIEQVKHLAKGDLAFAALAMQLKYVNSQRAYNGPR